MKFIKVLLLALTITITPMQKAEAAIAGIAALAGSGGAGGIALAGIIVPAILVQESTSGSCDGGLCGIAVLFSIGLGIVLLDEEGTVEFSKLSLEQAEKLNLTLDERNIFNEEIEEVNLVFSEVSSELSKDSTVEESRELWTEYKEALSPETFSVMQKIVSQK